MGSSNVYPADTFPAEFSTYKGALVPRPGTMAALRAVEADYYLDQDLAPNACAGSFPLNVALADEISGNPPLVGAGGAVLGAAWPGGLPQRPWESVA
jgi:hypothetical protein